MLSYENMGYYYGNLKMFKYYRSNDVFYYKNTRIDICNICMQHYPYYSETRTTKAKDKFRITVAEIVIFSQNC
jgi:hypothetical protein